MNSTFIFRNLRINLKSRKRNFILIFLLATITFYFLDLVFMLFTTSYYNINELNKIIDYNGEVINVSIHYDNSDYEYGRRIYEFNKELQEVFPQSYGKFMYMEDLTLSTGYGERKLNVLYIDKNLLKLINLKDESGELLKLDGEAGKLSAYIGSDLSEDFPVGSSLLNEYINTEICVVGELKKDSRWLNGNPMASKTVSISLNNTVLVAMDERFLVEYEYMFCANITNSMFIMCDVNDKNKVVAEISGLAKEHGVMCYINSINDLITDELLANKELFEGMGMLVIFSLSVAILAFFTVSIADNIIRQRENGILNIIGGSRRAIYLIELSENLLKYGAAFILAVSFYGRDLETTDKYVHSLYVAPVLGILALVLISGLSLIPVIYINKKGVLAMMGGGVND